jgi:elongation factor 1-alpha
MPKRKKKISVPRKENKNIEFKERLFSSVHLKGDKKQHLVAQMKYRLEIGKGTVIYIIGVDDNGKAKGLTELEFQETLNILNLVAMENNAKIDKMEKFPENGKLIGRIIIRSEGKPVKQHIILGTCGHVDHGKSTLIAALMTGKPDKKGKHWLYLDTLPHEIERGLSADLHYALYGFKAGNALTLKNPLDKKERSKLVENADKVVSFVDSPGHEPWLHTAIRGLVGQSIDYGILVVAADDGIMPVTKEHLGLLIAMNLPMIICLTKTDKVSKKKIGEVEEEVDKLLKGVGRVPYKVQSADDIAVVIDKLETVVPLIKTSAKTLEGYNTLNKLLLVLPERKKDLEKPFLMFIDRTYNITGVGTVVSGTIKQGRLHTGKDLSIGPYKAGKFRKVRAKTIEMHYHRLSEANAGLVVGIALRGVKHEEVKRGMVLCDPAVKPKVVKSFEAEILVLNHPTSISSGYEPIIHLSTISQTVKLKILGKRYLKSGDTGKVVMNFKYEPQVINVDDKFVFREGKTKGIGKVTKIVG